MRWRRTRSCSVSRIAALEGMGAIKEEEKNGLLMWGNATLAAQQGVAKPRHHMRAICHEGRRKRFSPWPVNLYIETLRFTGQGEKRFRRPSSKPLYRDIDTWRTAHGDDHEWPNPASCGQ